VRNPFHRRPVIAVRSSPHGNCSRSPFDAANFSPLPYRRWHASPDIAGDAALFVIGRLATRPMRLSISRLYLEVGVCPVDFFACRLAVARQCTPGKAPDVTRFSHTAKRASSMRWITSTKNDFMLGASIEGAGRKRATRVSGRGRLAAPRGRERLRQRKSAAIDARYTIRLKIFFPPINLHRHSPVSTATTGAPTASIAQQSVRN